MAAEGRIGGGKSRRRRRRDARASLSHSSNSTHFTYCPRQLLPILTRLPPTLALTFPMSHLRMYTDIPTIHTNIWYNTPRKWYDMHTSGQNKEQLCHYCHCHKNENHHPSGLSSFLTVNQKIIFTRADFQIWNAAMKPSNNFLCDNNPQHKYVFSCEDANRTGFTHCGINVKWWE